MQREYKEYIEREEAKELFRIWISDCVLNGDNDAADCFRDCIDILDSIPAADVAPVWRGRWFDSGDYVTTAYGSLPVKMCSECHMDVTLDDFDNYCPNCGAKMDVEEV